MRKWILLLGVICSSSHLLLSADQYSKGDTLYVWAKNGLNLRKKPNTKSKIVAKIPFGSFLIIQNSTDQPFHVFGIKPNNVPNSYVRKSDPVIFKGKWVQVVDQSGQSGYVIDQYLLRHQPSPERNFSFIPFDILRVDTTFINPVPQDGGALNLSKITYLEHGITITSEWGGVWILESYKLPDHTLEEALVRISASLDNFKNWHVRRNWKEEIILVDDGICGLRIWMDHYIVRMEYTCSC